MYLFKPFHATPHLRRCVSIAYLLVVCCLTCAAWSASAVLSDLEIIGGQRGLALTLKADAPFGLKVEEAAAKKNSHMTVLSITCDHVIYGLDEFEFSTFPSSCPMRHITVTESPAHGSIQMQCVLSSPIEKPVQSKQKQNKWIILLSHASHPDFNWNALSAAPTARPAKPAKEAEVSGAQEKTGSSRLSDITILSRDKVEVLTFLFKGATTMRLKRETDKIIALFVNTTSGLPATSFSFKNDPVNSIQLKQVAHGGTMWLGATILMKQAACEGAFVQTLEDRLVIYCTHDSLECVSYWTALRGPLASYVFVKIPRYEVDYKGMEKRALTDVQSDASRAKTFVIHEEQKEQPSVRPPVGQAAAPVIKEAPAPAPKRTPVAQPSAAVKKEPPIVRLLVTKNNAPLRSEPATDHKNIVAKLDLGTVATQAEKKGAWVKIISGQLQGWVSSSVVIDSAKASKALLQSIEKFRQQQTALQKAAEEKAAKEQLAKEKAQQEKLEKEKQLAQQMAQKKAALETKAQIAKDSSLGFSSAKEDSIQKAKNAPRRVLVEYHVYGRDPFLPLSRDQDSPVPDVVNLTLVGILYDEVDRIALFEDIQDKTRAYALRENDPVQNGYLLRIQPDKVLFLINELGISRTYALKLTKEKER